jgi:hypothetical protein
MSWSLQLRNGDLVLGGTSLAQVSGAQKMVQDLRCTILERMGTDDLHPWFGSLIDGGIQEGVQQPSLIGEHDWQVASLTVQSEIRRIITQYQDMQIKRIENDRITYGASSLNPDEVLLGIQNIQIFQAEDRMMVKIALLTGINQTVNLDVSIDI